MAAQVQMSAQERAAQMAQGNYRARDLINRTALDVVTQIYAASGLSPAQMPVLNISPRNVGLIKGFFVEVAFDVTAPAGAALTRSPFGPTNILSQIVFTDLNNNVRHNTAGWHMHMVTSARNRHLQGARFTADAPNTLMNTPTVFAPATIPAGTTARCVMVYEIPIAYSADDLRGAIFANVVSATMNLQLTFNTGAVVASAANDAFACYKSAGAAGTVGNVAVVVSQYFADQLPQTPQGPLLPVLDLQTLYMLNTTNMSGLAANQDFAIPYANFRDFLSTSVVFDNGGILSVDGSDVVSLAMRSANLTDIFRMSPRLNSFLTTNRFYTDTVAGSYYFSHGRKPISTVQFGNMELLIQPALVRAGANVTVGWESMGQQGQLVGAASLALN